MQAARRDFAALSSIMADFRVGREEAAISEMLDMLEEFGKLGEGGTCESWFFGGLGRVPSLLAWRACSDLWLAGAGGLGHLFEKPLWALKS